jgi:hypothetical protein
MEIGMFLSTLPAGTRLKVLEVENKHERRFLVSHPEGRPFMLLVIRDDGTFKTRTLTAAEGKGY